MSELYTLAQAKDWIAARFDEGADCPCCDQRVQRYRRKLNSNMAVFLISLVRASRARSATTWISHLDLSYRGRDYSTVSFWGLAETAVVADGDKRTSGMWRITPKGVAFARGGLSVPSHVYIYNNQELGFSEAEIGIVEALGSRFNYQELISGDRPQKATTP